MIAALSALLISTGILVIMFRHWHKWSRWEIVTITQSKKCESCGLSKFKTDTCWDR